MLLCTEHCSCLLTPHDILGKPVEVVGKPHHLRARRADGLSYLYSLLLELLCCNTRLVVWVNSECRPALVAIRVSSQS